MSLRILEPGLCSLIVDQGRPGSRSLGVPVGGAADHSALAVGNSMLGNDPDVAALEITLVGPSLVALQRVGAVVVGAPFQLTSTHQPLAANKAFTLEPNEELHIGGAPHGARAYLCVVGGLQTARVLGSRCSLTPLRGGEKLTCDESGTAPHLVRDAFPWEVVPSLAPELRAGQHCLRVVAGPQADWFSGPLERAESWTISPASDRMGLRLSGPLLPAPARELISEPVCPGAIQVTQDGQPIILGIDGQTIGGYPKVAQVISADLDLLGQLRPGNLVSFETITLERAEEIYRARVHNLGLLCQRLRLAAQAF
jgi:antagonist of KipI